MWKIIFDLDDSLMYNIQNRDFLWRPEPLQTKRKINYFQWITEDTNQREPVLSVLSYLFDKFKSYYREPYDHEDNEKEAINHHYQKIKIKYGTLERYLEDVSQKLWYDKNFIKNNYCILINKFNYSY